MEEKTLRDEFAMAAMAIVKNDWQTDLSLEDYGGFAEDCYRLASSMMAVKRSRETNEKE